MYTQESNPKSMKDNIIKLAKLIIAESQRNQELDKQVCMDCPESWPEDLRQIFQDYCNAKSLKCVEECECCEEEDDEEEGKMDMMMQDTGSGEEE